MFYERVTLMYLSVRDGVAVFATHLIRTEIKDRELAQKLAPFPLQVEAEGIVCYSQDEAERAKKALDDLGIPYVEEELQHDQAHKEKARGVKYASRSEAIAHLVEDKEPESQVLPNLRKRLNDKDAEIAELRAEKQALRDDLNELKNDMRSIKGLLETRQGEVKL